VTLYTTHPLTSISAFPGDHCLGIWDTGHSLHLGSSVPELSCFYSKSTQCDCLALSGLVSLSVKAICGQKHCSVCCRYGINDETLPWCCHDVPKWSILSLQLRAKARCLQWRRKESGQALSPSSSISGLDLKNSQRKFGLEFLLNLAILLI